MFLVERQILLAPGFDPSVCAALYATVKSNRPQLSKDGRIKSNLGPLGSLRALLMLTNRSSPDLILCEKRVHRGSNPGPPGPKPVR